MVERLLVRELEMVCCCCHEESGNLITKLRHALLGRKMEEEEEEEQVCRLPSDAWDILVVVFQQLLEDVKPANQQVLVLVAVAPVSRLPKTSPLSCRSVSSPVEW
jgi:hypothetical protein